MRTPLIVLAVLLVAFTSADAISPNQVAKRMEQARAHNRAGLNRLAIGMDKKTVLETMGTETVKAGGYATITNPGPGPVCLVKGPGLDNLKSAMTIEVAMFLLKVWSAFLVTLEALGPIKKT